MPCRLSMVSGAPLNPAEPAQRVQARSCSIYSTVQQLLVLPRGDQGDGTQQALVKRLLRITPEKWRVRQFNPAKDFDLDRSQ